MKNTIVAALALATVWIGTPAFAGVTMSAPYFPPGTPNLADTIGSQTGLGNAAGSIAAGANSAWNPSGNSFIQPPPGVGAGEIVGHRR
jgi:hypothetical protein